jgi:hypothetical protein
MIATHAAAAGYLKPEAWSLKPLRSTIALSFLRGNSAGAPRAFGVVVFSIGAMGRWMRYVRVFVAALALFTARPAMASPLVLDNVPHKYLRH